MPKLRLDKWLWHARFVKTRGLAASLVVGGHVRVNSAKAAKPAHMVGPGDVLTFPQGDNIRVVRILAIGLRRGPAPEAQMLYADLSEVKDDVPRAPRYEGKGRPTKRERRKLDLDRAQELE
ncbi:heat shock protein Hsp15 [Thalassovita taeanensis]|uniref:Heat shock protein Hsp15 n=1 Tax=Thalassovita taeanensis TaxID=657014 RepID=A0A1H9KK65_9RHOB|nr:heat shock protein Hsp15 [Thalassovita taeanensis]